MQRLVVSQVNSICRGRRSDGTARSLAFAFLREGKVSLGRLEKCWMRLTFILHIGPCDGMGMSMCPWSMC